MSDAADSWQDRLLDRINPIVVKEIRQGLRTKVFWIFFTVMLCTCFLIALTAWATDGNDEGDGYFLAFFIALGGVCFFVIPYNAFRSLARERDDESWVLLTLTGLGPRRILRGKLGSSLIQATLYASAATPFLLFSYFLNGIDLPTILVVVALGTVYTAFLISLSVGMAALGQSRVVRALGHFAILGVLLQLAGSGLLFAGFFSQEGSGAMREPEFVPLLVGGLWAMGAVAALIFQGAVARLSLLSENYSRGLRLTFLGVLAGSLLGAAYLWHFNRYERDVAAITFQMFCFGFAIIVLPIATDRDGQAPIQRRLTGPFSLFRPGAVRAFRLVLLALVAMVGAFAALGSFSTVGDHVELSELPLVLLPAPLYFLLYLSVALLAGRMRPFAAMGEVTGSRVAFMVLLVLSFTLSPIAAAATTGRYDFGLINLLNPMLGMVSFLDGAFRTSTYEKSGLLDGGALYVLGAISLSAALVADRVLAARDQARV
jgi:hypothetical protein